MFISQVKIFSFGADPEISIGKLMIDQGQSYEFGTKSGNIYDKTLYGPCDKVSAFFIINFGPGISLILLLFSHMY